MMTSSSLSKCFAFLKELLVEPPLITPSSHKMDIMIITTVLSMLMVGCMGADPERANSTSDLKEKIFNIFHKTSLHEGDHAREMKYHWNKENPSRYVSDHEPFYNYALSVIEEKCRDFECLSRMRKEDVRRELSKINQGIAANNPGDRKLIHEKFLNDFPQFRYFTPDLTWSVVHDWHHHFTENVAKNIGEWTRDMKASLLYIQQKVREKGNDTMGEITNRWMELYPQFHVSSTDMERLLREVHEEGFHPTENDMMNAKKKYDRKFSKPRGKERMTWTSQMKTDLVYIAIQFNPRDILLSQKIKAKWDHMNSEYAFITKEALCACLYTLSIKGDFVPEAERLQNTIERYNNTPPSEIIPPKNRNTRFRESLVDFLIEMKKSIARLKKNMDLHEVRSHDTGRSPSPPQHTHIEQSQEGEASAPHGYYPSEFQQNPNAPIQFLQPFSELGHFPHQGMYHYPDVSGLHLEGSSSTPYPSHGGHFSGGEISLPLVYHQPELTQNLGAPIHPPFMLSGYEHPSGHDMQHYSNFSESRSLISTPRTPSRSLRREGGPSAFHEYRRPNSTQNVTAPIHPSSMPPGHEHPSDIGMHLSSIVTRHEPGALPPTPRTARISRLRKGGSSAFHEYRQPRLTQEASAPTQSPRVPTEFGLPPGYGIQTSPSDLTSGSQSRTPRSRRGEGSGTPKTRRRQPQE